MCEICQFVESLVLWFYPPCVVIISMVKNLKKKVAPCLNWLWDNGSVVVTTWLRAIPVINEHFTTAKCLKCSIMSNDYYLSCILWFVFPLIMCGHLQMQVWLIWQWSHFDSLTTDDLKLQSTWYVSTSAPHWGGRAKVKERVISKKREFAAQ